MEPGPITILLIEDNPGDARLIGEMLADAGEPVTSLEWVDRLSAGVDRLAAGGIDVVLLDLSLPDGQGIDVCKRIRDAAPRVPIVVLTGLDDRPTATGVLQMGVQDYLVKGQIDSALLLRSVRYAIERTQATEMLTKAKEAAEAADAAKSEFLSRVSHEIRTPIHGAIGMLDLALDTELTQEQREYLSIARSSADSLLAIINDVLDFSKIGVRQLPLDWAPFDLREVVEQAADMVALRAHKKGLELLCDLPPDVPISLIGDAGKLRQVLVNLLGNAVKFTAEGEVAVCTDVISQNEFEVELEFTVRDTGIGVPEAMHDVIFEAFRQVDGSTSRTYGGTGLGLTISRQLIELMGGRVWVESRSGEGATFHFTACLSRQTPDQSAARDEAITPLEGMPVLVVDDNDASRDILQQMLGGWGMEVTGAQDGPSALEELERVRLTRSPFGLALLDRAMPGMDGFDVAERILNDPALADTIVLMLSSDSISDDSSRCRELGISSYLVKPVKRAALLETIQDALRRQPSPRTERQAAEKTVNNDGQGFNILVAEDNLAARIIVKKRLEARGYRVWLATNGVEALEALERDAFDLVLMDVEMPQMSGLEATRRIREREAGSGGHIPVIAMTAYALEEDRERCRQAGMDAHVSKPIDYEVLHGEMQRLAAVTSRWRLTQASLDPASWGDRWLMSIPAPQGAAAGAGGHPRTHPPAEQERQ